MKEYIDVYIRQQPFFLQKRCKQSINFMRNYAKNGNSRFPEKPLFLTKTYADVYIRQ